MAYNGAHAPAQPGQFWYGVGDEGTKGLGVLGAELSNGTSVLLVMNKGEAPVVYQLKTSKGRSASIKIPAHGIQTLRWNE